MKKIILCLITLFAFMSCEMIATDPLNEVKVSFGVPIEETGSRIVSTILNPTVNYTLLKNGVIYLATTGASLTNVNGSYSLDLKLLTANSYKFTQFDVYDGTTLMYSLDSVNQENIDGFVVDKTGSVTPNPTRIHLNSEYGDGFKSSVLPVLGDYDILSDSAPAGNLTFKATIPTGLSVAVQHKYNHLEWTSAQDIHKTLLNNNDVYDMDVRKIYDPLETGDDSVLTMETSTAVTDDFRFIIQKGTSIRYVYFNSAEVNKKEVIFYDDPSIGDITGDLTGGTTTSSQLYGRLKSSGAGYQSFKVSTPPGKAVAVHGSFLYNHATNNYYSVSAILYDGETINLRTMNTDFITGARIADKTYDSFDHPHCDYYNYCILNKFTISYNGKSVDVKAHEVSDSLLIFK